VGNKFFLCYAVVHSVPMRIFADIGSQLELKVTPLNPPGIQLLFP
jgi:hypothetical protein